MIVLLREHIEHLLLIGMQLTYVYKILQRFIIRLNIVMWMENGNVKSVIMKIILGGNNVSCAERQVRPFFEYLNI